MGAGKGKSRRLRQIALSETSSCKNRGYRFFTWAGNSADDEQEVDAKHPYVKLFSQLEQQIAVKLLKRNVDPLANLDICFFNKPLTNEESEGEAMGTTGINVDSRIQLTFHISPERLKEKLDLFVQAVCHEYCHALFMRAFFQAYSGDSRPQYDKKNIGIVDEVKHGDTVAGEALADAFVLAVHNNATVFYDEEKLLQYEELMQTDEYVDAHSLKRFLFSLINDAKDSEQRGEFIFEALKIRANDSKLGLMKCLQCGVEADLSINPEQKTFPELYDKFVNEYNTKLS